MKKLNNRGITTIEVILCFVLVVIIAVVMYSTISTFNEKRLIESYKGRIYTYKNILTKDIQDDFIKKGLTHATYTRKTSGSMGSFVTYTVNCELRDGTKRQLIIEQRLAQSDYHEEGNPNVDDHFMIKYGSPDDPDGLVEYPIPDLGETKATNNHIAKDLSINNISIKISQNNVLTIYIGFYHPELGTRYGINIICPINFVSAGSDMTNGFS